MEQNQRQKKTKSFIKKSTCLCISMLLFLSFFSVTSVSAQSITVKGTVKDVSGEAVIGANVVVKGTSTGTITDLDGAFTLNTERNKILVVSFIGYSSLEVPAS